MIAVFDSTSPNLHHPVATLLVAAAARRALAAAEAAERSADRGGRGGRGRRRRVAAQARAAGVDGGAEARRPCDTA